MSSELEWLRQQLWIAIVAPRSFARRLASEHFGLGGPIVALAAGASLSLGLDILVISSRGFDPLAFIPRLLTNAFFLALRLAITAVIVSAVAYAVLRLARRQEGASLDALVTASSFALAPLLAAFAAALPAILEPLLGPPGAIVVLVLVARALYGLGANFLAILPRPMGITALVVVIAVGTFALSDEIWRARYVAYAYAPVLAPDLASPPLAGRTAERFGVSLTVPDRWHDQEARTGELMRIETDIDAAAVRRTGAMGLLTLGDAADDFARTETFAMRDLTSRRDVVRIDGRVTVDDRYRGTIGGTHIVVRIFTTLAGPSAYALAFRSIDPADVDGMFAEAAMIAGSWRIARTP